MSQRPSARWPKPMRSRNRVCGLLSQCNLIGERRVRIVHIHKLVCVAEPVLVDRNIAVRNYFRRRTASRDSAPIHRDL